MSDERALPSVPHTCRRKSVERPIANNHNANYSHLCAALAADPTFEIAIRDHKFVPSEITVPAGQKIKLIVKNEDATPEEFESKRLNREKVIAGRSQATIYIGPLKAGEHPFVGEFHESTATGKIVVK